ncbi:MAG TPA: POTRA domain-containing protein, partial [Thermoanaerobaculia bacterium]|nr:POTRA domain-containing protein [Thermoanaerobaculia bacterium]
MKTILTVALALIAATASAKSFLIERIDINAAKRISPAIVLAEMRIDAGKTYSDEQLQQALNRVRRLPFVLFASADLKPGSTPDAFVLRINIEEMANFNWTFDMDAVARQRGGGAKVAGNAGYRFFPGHNGTLDASIGDTNETFIPGAATSRSGTLAYNGWGLFGTRAYGGVAVGTIFRTNGRHDVNPSALLGVPLTRTQSIEATFARTTERLERSVSGIADPVRSFTRVTDYGVAWLLQTADDPYFARHGFDAGAGSSWVRNELDLPFVLTFPKPPHVVPGRQSQRELVLSANAAKYW